MYCALCLLFSLGAYGGGPVSNLAVFGDSLSDTGNGAAARNALAELPVDLCNPVDIVSGRGCEDVIFQQRSVSDGPLAVEVLAARFGLEARPSLHFLPLPDGSGPLNERRLDFGTNYAVLGAKARGDGPAALGAQVSGFLRDVADGFIDPSTVLVIIIIGGNDVIDALQALGSSASVSRLTEAAEAIVDAAVNAIGASVESLIEQGGVGHVLIANANRKFKRLF